MQIYHNNDKHTQKWHKIINTAWHYLFSHVKPLTERFLSRMDGNTSMFGNPMLPLNEAKTTTIHIKVLLVIKLLTLYEGNFTHNQYEAAKYLPLQGICIWMSACGRDFVSRA